MATKHIPRYVTGDNQPEERVKYNMMYSLSYEDHGNKLLSFEYSEAESVRIPRVGERVVLDISMFNHDVGENLLAFFVTGVTQVTRRPRKRALLITNDIFVSVELDKESTFVTVQEAE